VRMILTALQLWPSCNGHDLGSFLGGVSPSKIGVIAPY
jgi:hypothetical protein